MCSTLLKQQNVTSQRTTVEWWISSPGEMPTRWVSVRPELPTHGANIWRSGTRDSPIDYLSPRRHILLLQVQTCLVFPKGTRHRFKYERHESQRGRHFLPQLCKSEAAQYMWRHSCPRGPFTVNLKHFSSHLFLSFCVVFELSHSPLPTYSFLDFMPLFFSSFLWMRSPFFKQKW